MSEHLYCRALLRHTVAEVKKTLGPIDVKSASVEVSRGIGSNPNGEFWGPALSANIFTLDLVTALGRHGQKAGNCI